MKQVKGKGIAKASRQWTDADRIAKKCLKENIKVAEAKDELGLPNPTDDVDSSEPTKEEGK
jgi:hypothetical protein